MAQINIETFSGGVREDELSKFVINAREAGLTESTIIQDPENSNITWVIVSDSKIPDDYNSILRFISDNS